MDFPKYIKYPNGSSFVKLESMDRWEEIRIFGTKKTIIANESKNFSDRLYLQDLLQYLKEGKLEEIDEEEYNKMLLD
ncbi:MAG: hypothetical protein ACI8XB_000850 [Patiriisocius sp.]|jgi:hypothetical protein